MIKTGVVQYVDGNKITVDGEKYSAFSGSQIKCAPGDAVTFEYIEKNAINPRTGAPVVYKNIKGTVMGSAGMGMGVSTAPGRPTAATPGYSRPPEKAGEPILAKDRLILRQNALTAAVNYCSNLTTVVDPAPEEVIAVAKKFEYYTSGDMDVDAAEEALKADKAE